MKHIKFNALHLKLIAMTMLVLLINACGTEKKLKPGLFLLKSDQVKQIQWDDDRNLEGLDQSILQSIEYYKRLPDRYRFKYNDIQYSPQEMIASMLIFQELMVNADTKNLSSLIDQRFHVFESRNDNQQAFFTAYYEPVLSGCTQRSSKYSVPLYEMPPDLARIHVGDFDSRYDGVWITGRVKGKAFIPYETRDDIVYKKALESRAEVIAFVQNHIELFFLQIQGSGQVCFEKDGSCIRVNYAGQNGRPYRAVGKILTDSIPKEKMSLQAIKQYLYDHPDDIRRVLKYNPSYTFFRTVSKGPLGNIQVPLTAWRSIAMDHRIIPKGGLAFYQTTIPVYENNTVVKWKPTQCFALVQDTGGAIRGHGRADIFLGGGKKAELLAGPMKQDGHIFLFVAKKACIALHSPSID
ncbi:MAG: membrane-bound lytic murein transglycosylase A [Candidatus Magnetoglobus multicellularis str. Araruama]|uniref:peptidoglycan lytic exotransglycosylase n=1 Tax=Candidatus Magnetoglobus multicellularis str. Araruama TaxID=890399 RepID=A0A1V1PBA5_9BACT|nr:MAG: membrane-bound lytic murein transglycosylase A [Candidatus Magnetoglobus multicellularis str. Araruama]